MESIYNDIFDIHSMMVCFRVLPERVGAYLPALREISDKLAKASLSEGFVRSALRGYFDKNDDILAWVCGDKPDDGRRAELSGEYCAVLSRVISEMAECHGDRGREYLLCDCVHNFPLMMADGEFLPLETDMRHALLVADAGMKLSVLLGVERGMGHGLMRHSIEHSNILCAEFAQWNAKT